MIFWILKPIWIGRSGKNQRLWPKWMDAHNTIKSPCVAIWHTSIVKISLFLLSISRPFLAKRQFSSIKSSAETEHQFLADSQNSRLFGICFCWFRLKANRWCASSYHGGDFPELQLAGTTICNVFVEFQFHSLYIRKDPQLFRYIRIFNQQTWLALFQHKIYKILSDKIITQVSFQM